MAEKDKIFKCEAQDDIVYIKAKDLDGAKARLREVMEEIPETLLTWTEAKKLPKGQEFL